MTIIASRSGKLVSVKKKEKKEKKKKKRKRKNVEFRETKRKVFSF